MCSWKFLNSVVLFLSCIYLTKGIIINQDVERTLDLSTQLVKELVKITVEESKGEPITKYTYIIPKNERKRLAYLSAKDGSKKDIKIKEENSDQDSKFVLTLDSLLSTQTILINAVYTKAIIPHPKEISQNDKQLVKYTGNLYFYSPYKTTSQKTNVKLSSSNIISYTQIKPFTTSGNKIKYGPYNDIEALSNETLVLHYENNTPFLTITKLERTIEVSHWGNIAIKENIYMKHSGAVLKGSFSRYEFQKDGRSGLSAVKSYKTVLPASATDVYYRDTNGNISTSNMKILRDSVELELRPRFPLFGGWKTQYTIGYNVPSFEYLYVVNNNYFLKMRVIDHIFDDMEIDEAEVTIILPEVCTNIELSAPFEINRQADRLHYTYLDTVGRPVISFTKTNLVENHIADFKLKYTFSNIAMINEPLLVIAFIFIIFIVTIICMRLDFSIATTPHLHKD